MEQSLARLSVEEEVEGSNPANTPTKQIHGDPIVCPEITKQEIFRSWVWAKLRDEIMDGWRHPK